MSYFPAFLDLRGRRCLVVGATPAAARKAVLLAGTGADVRHVAIFAPADLDGCVLAIGASDDVTERALAQAAAVRCLPVNIVDRPELSTFIVPAIVERGAITIAISTGGAAPGLARLLRARIESVVPAAAGDLASLARRFRARVAASLPDAGARRRFWDGALTGRVAELVFAGRSRDAARALARLLARASLPAIGPVEGHVALVMPPADPELLTLKALRLLHEADAIVHDRAAPTVVIAAGRRDAALHAVDTAAERDALLIRLARQGKRVVWLGADCNAGALAVAGIAAEVVPAVTAATPSERIAARA
jgi:uroporphyrin-III C-methyltransferase/precorrin-2 dehydrogenase/sirohydrochlorin ferrochelatase